jgi:predicted ABC-class ATPase
MAPPARSAHHRTPLPSGTGLRGILRAIDGDSFQTYRRILGDHELGDFRLTVQSVPPDALGGPARLRLGIDRARAGLEAAWSHGATARLVLEDAIVRAASHAIDDLNGPTAASAPGSGRVWIDPPGPVLVERTSARVGDDGLDVSLAFDLPAAGRRVRGQQAELILFEHLPRVGMSALLFPLRRLNDLRRRIENTSRRHAAAGALSAKGLAALVPLSALPGRTVAPDRRATIETPHGPVEGLAVPTGITVFLTTGVNGVGSWLRALAAGSGPVPGETAVLAAAAATLRASRRAFGPVDLSAFVRACPEVPDPERYATDDAPAPLALAASLTEAVEAGARILVVDEDDIPAGAFAGTGPLDPFAIRLAELRDRWGLSFLIAARSLGGWGDVADTVFIMRDDRLEDATDAVRASYRSGLGPRRAGARAVPERPPQRAIRVVTTGRPAELKVAAWGGRGVRVGEDLIDLKDTTLAGDAARLRTIAALLKRAASLATAWRPVEDVLDALETASARDVLERLHEPGLVDLVRPSRIELATALARWKRVTFRTDAGKLRGTPEDVP